MTQAALVPALLSAYHRGQFPMQVQMDPHGIAPSIPIEVIDSDGSKVSDSLERAGVSSDRQVESQGLEEGARVYKMEEADFVEDAVENADEVDDQQDDVEVHVECDAERSTSAAADGEEESILDDTVDQKSGSTEVDDLASGDGADDGLLDERDEDNPKEDVEDTEGYIGDGGGLAESVRSTTQAESIESYFDSDSAVVDKGVQSNNVDVVIVPVTQEEGEGGFSDDQEQYGVPVSGDDDSNTYERTEGREEDWRDGQESEATYDLSDDTNTSSKGPFRRLMDRFWPGSGKHGKAS